MENLQEMEPKAKKVVCACFSPLLQHMVLYSPFFYFLSLCLCHFSFIGLGADSSGKIEVEPGSCYTSRLHRAYPTQATLTQRQSDAD